MARVPLRAMLVVLVGATLCLGHGVTYEVVETTVGLTAKYRDGTPMAYCDATVYSPGDSESEFQTGTTDPNGCVAFVPDTAGVWRVTVDDGMGHLLTAQVPVGTEGVASAEASHHVDSVSSAIVGISVIFGLFGVLTLIRSRARGGPTTSTY